MTLSSSGIARGAIWMVLAKLIERAIGFVSIMILARILFPRDFGIVAMAMSFMAFLELLNAFGFDTALIQRQSREREYFDTAWTFNVILGCGVALLMVVFAEIIAEVYQEPAVAEAIRFLAIGSIAQGLQNIGVVTFRLEMQFDREFRYLLLTKLSGFIVTVPLALALRSYWALVLGMVAGRIVQLVLSYVLHPFRPRLGLQKAPEMLGFSKWLLLVNAISYFKERSSDWVIGANAGPAALGTFNMSYEIACLPSTELAAPVNRAAFPGYARLAGDRVALRREFLSVMGVIVLIAVPCAFGLAATAPLVVPLLLGPNWMQAIPIMAILSLFALTHIVQSNAQAAYLAIGRPDVPAKINGAQVILQLTALIPLTGSFGLIGAGAAFAAVAVVMIPVSIVVILKLLSLPVRSLFSATWRPLVSACVMYGGTVTFVALYSEGAGGLSTLVRLLAAIGIGILLYGGVLALLWYVSGRPNGAERDSIDKVRMLLARLLSG